MIAILLTGRSGSQSVPKKNVYPVLGRPLVYYPMNAAVQSRLADALYVSTDCPDIKRVGNRMGVQVIDRPPELSRADSELTDAIIHAIDQMEVKPDILVTMHCNCAVHREGLVDACIQKLLDHSDADSCVTGSVDRSVHPFRTKRVTQDGYLTTWMDMPAETSTNRQDLDPCFILDGAARAMRVGSCFPPRDNRRFVISAGVSCRWTTSAEVTSTRSKTSYSPNTCCGNSDGARPILPGTPRFLSDHSSIPWPEYHLTAGEKELY